MTALILFIISCGASVVGAITGIGGGIIIKPLVDAAGLLTPDTVNFLSGCTVLAMSAVSVMRNRSTGFKIDNRRTPYLAVGAAAGGFCGRLAFRSMMTLVSSTQSVTVFQNIIILLLTAIVLWYELYSSKFRTFNINSHAVITCIGLALGIISSFLGIGGGPINIMLLGFLFSMKGKELTVNSLLIVLFSQISALGCTIFLGVPGFEPAWLLVMVFGGISGGIIGNAVLRRISVKNMEYVFRALLAVIMAVCIYNIAV
ncbi:MAG: TSUP family transporter [Candidatus Ornithomonoglobus sp.]